MGKLVLLKNPLLPSCKWELGRIVKCHPGQDNLTRVVTVKTAYDGYKRPIAQICLLPIDIESSNLDNDNADCKQPTDRLKTIN